MASKKALHPLHTQPLQNMSNPPYLIIDSESDIVSEIIQI